MRRPLIERHGPSSLRWPVPSSALSFESVTVLFTSASLAKLKLTFEFEYPREWAGKSTRIESKWRWPHKSSERLGLGEAAMRTASLVLR